MSTYAESERTTPRDIGGMPVWFIVLPDSGAPSLDTIRLIVNDDLSHAEVAAMVTCVEMYFLEAQEDDTPNREEVADGE